MSKIAQTIKDICLWSYERGTWQYDLIVLAILAFIFLTPGAFFNTDKIDKKILAYGSPASAASQDSTEEKKDETKKPKEQIKRNPE